MSRKQVFLFFLLALSSIFSGSTFGLLDVFGFIDGRHAISFTLLITSGVLLYISMISIFLLDIAHTKKSSMFIVLSSVLFGITFFLINLNILISALAVVSYYLLLHYASRTTEQRFNDFVRFKPEEIFFPALRNSYLFILIMLAFLAYGQSQKLISTQSLITPHIVQLAMKPGISVINQQLNSQLQSEVGGTLAQLPEQERVQAVRMILKKTVENMAKNETNSIYGIPESEIPVHKASVNSSGKVDVAPVFEAMQPIIAVTLNTKLVQYALITPIVIALVTFLLFQPLTIPLQIVESATTLLIFKILIATKFITICKIEVEAERLSM